jgi:hypothetical protein
MSQFPVGNTRLKTKRAPYSELSAIRYPLSASTAVKSFTDRHVTANASQVRLLHTDKASAQVDGHKDQPTLEGSGRVFGATS